MKLLIISGSSRKGSESLRVSKYIKNLLKEKSTDSDILDLNENALSVVPDQVWGGDASQGEIASKIKEQLNSADGYVVVSPEWSGMACPAIKNLMIHVDNEMGHKPALIIAVSSTRGGAYPVAELRMSSYKNTLINYIPEHLIVRDVNNVFHGEVDERNKADVYIRNRAEYAVDILIEYTKALEGVRKSGVINDEDYPHGM